MVLLHFILHDLSLFVDPVHSFGYQRVILDGFTLGELLFSYIVSMVLHRMIAYGFSTKLFEATHQLLYWGISHFVWIETSS